MLSLLWPWVHTHTYTLLRHVMFSFIITYILKTSYSRLKRTECSSFFFHGHIHCRNIIECFPYGMFYCKGSPCQQLYNPYTANMKEVFSRAKPQWKETLVIIKTANEVWSHLKPWNKESRVSSMIAEPVIRSHISTTWQNKQATKH